MNLWSYISGANAEPADDRAVLIKVVDSDSANGANVDGRNDDNEKEQDADKHTADDSAECERCERDRLVESEDSKGLECSSSVEVTEVYVVEEQAKNKKRKKPLRKRVSYVTIISVFVCLFVCFSKYVFFSRLRIFPLEFQVVFLKGRQHLQGVGLRN